MNNILHEQDSPEVLNLAAREPSASSLRQYTTHYLYHLNLPKGSPMEGTLVWFSIEKKIGLVKDNSGKVFLVHSEQLPKTKALTPGTKIKFQLGSFPGFIEAAKESKR